MERPDGTPFNSNRRSLTAVTTGFRYSLDR
jgi:hypothetical protein